MTTPERLRARQRRESALIVVLCFMLVGAWLYFRGQTSDTQRELQAQADANSAINNCLSGWAADLTLALQDRDAVNRTARAAQREVWAEVSEWLRGDNPDRTPMITAIEKFREVLRRLERLNSLNPYPEIVPCFAATDALGTLALMAYTTKRGQPCWGRSVTIVGTPGADTLIGTDGPDVIFAGRGDDLISAERGHDLICAGRGDDTINGGPGRDQARGGTGADVCIQVEEQRSC